MTEDYYAAMCALIALPDPPGMRRGYRYTQTRPLSPTADTVKQRLGTAYVERRRQDERDISCVVSVRRHPRLRMVQRA